MVPPQLPAIAPAVPTLNYEPALPSDEQALATLESGPPRIPRPASAVSALLSRPASGPGEQARPSLQLGPAGLLAVAPAVRTLQSRPALPSVGQATSVHTGALQGGHGAPRASLATLLNLEGSSTPAQQGSTASVNDLLQARLAGLGVKPLLGKNMKPPVPPTRRTAQMPPPSRVGNATASTLPASQAHTSVHVHPAAPVLPALEANIESAAAPPTENDVEDILASLEGVHTCLFASGQLLLSQCPCLSIPCFTFPSRFLWEL